MTDDRTLRQLLEDTQAQLRSAQAEIAELKVRRRVSALRAKAEMDRAQLLEEEAANLRAQLASMAQADLGEKASKLQGELAELQHRLKQLDHELPPTAIRLDVCAKCGSRRVIPGASIKDSSDSSVAARVLRDPHGVERYPQRVELITWLCGSCGYAEVFAERPEVLYAAYLDHKRNVRKPKWPRGEETP